MRRLEWALAAGLAAGAIGAAVLGRASGWNEDVLDPRASTYLTGPDGASGLARTLEILGIRVERLERPMLGLEPLVDSGSVLALLDTGTGAGDQELAALRRHTETRGDLFVAGPASITRCFGYHVNRPADADSVARVVHAVRGTVIGPPALAVLDTDPDASAGGEPDRGCADTVARTDTILRTTAGEPVALTLHVRGGGTVKLLADVSYVTNEGLKDTSAGLLVMPWLLDGGHRRVVFDEYHHGFRQQRSLWRAAWDWAWSNPAGWAMLHGAGAILVGLMALAVRFGPPTRRTETSRRSELEHVDALSMGLRRTRGYDSAVRLLMQGLRRRLGGTGRGGARGADELTWLSSLAATGGSPTTARAVRRLQTIDDVPAHDRVLTAAHAVEDIWNDLGSR